MNESSGAVQYCILDNSGDNVWNYNIYDFSFNYYYLTFVLLWSCEQGNVIGGTYSGARADCAANATRPKERNTSATSSSSLNQPGLAVYLNILNIFRP